MAFDADCGFTFAWVHASAKRKRPWEAWPITAAAPQRIYTVFPIVPSDTPRHLSSAIRSRQSSSNVHTHFRHNRYALPMVCKRTPEIRNAEKRIQARFVFWRRQAILQCRENSSRQYRGSDWVVLALSYRLALGVATSILFAHYESSRAAVRGLSLCLNSHRLERLQHQHSTHQARQDRQRNPAPDVRHFRPAQLAFANLDLLEACEQSIELPRR